MQFSASPSRVKTLRTHRGHMLTLEFNNRVPEISAFCKNRALTDTSEGYAVAAIYQDEPHGLLARPPFSSHAPHVYLSVLLRPSFTVQDASLLSALAAVSVCRVIERFSNLHPTVRWVNDVYCNKKRIAAIQTEASLNPGGSFNHMIFSFGIRFSETLFPPRLSDMMQQVFSGRDESLPEAMAEALLTDFYYQYEMLASDRSGLDEYRSRSEYLGRRLRVRINGSVRWARVVDLDTYAHLVVELHSGERHTVYSAADLLVRR